MIVGITGTICAGKHEIVRYLIKTCGFEAVNILDIFKQKLLELIKARKQSEDSSEQKEEEIDLSDGAFCSVFYQNKYSDLRTKIIKDTFK